MDDSAFLTIHKARQDGMSHLEIYEALEAAGIDPIPAMREYGKTRLPDGRLAAQMNPADPAEWSDESAPATPQRPGAGHREVTR